MWYVWNIQESDYSGGSKHRKRVKTVHFKALFYQGNGIYQCSLLLSVLQPPDQIVKYIRVTSVIRSQDKAIRNVTYLIKYIRS